MTCCGRRSGLHRVHESPSYEAAYRLVNRPAIGLLRVLIILSVVWEYRNESDPVLLFVESQVGSLITYCEEGLSH